MIIQKWVIDLIDIKIFWLAIFCFKNADSAVKLKCQVDFDLLILGDDFLGFKKVLKCGFCAVWEVGFGAFIDTKSAKVQILPKYKIVQNALIVCHA